MYPKQQVFFIGHLSSLKIPWFCWCLRHSFESLLQVLAPAQTTPGNTRSLAFLARSHLSSCCDAGRHASVPTSRTILGGLVDLVALLDNIKDQPRSANLSNLLPMVNNKTKQIEAFFEWFLPPPHFWDLFILVSVLLMGGLGDGQTSHPFSLEMAFAKPFLGGPRSCKQIKYDKIVVSQQLHVWLSTKFGLEGFFWATLFAG